MTIDADFYVNARRKAVRRAKAYLRHNGAVCSISDAINLAISEYNNEVGAYEENLTAELRAERAKLQDENASLRHDLRQATSEPRCGEVPSDTPSVRDLHDIVERLTALVERQAKAIAEVEHRLAKLQYQVIVELGEQVEAQAVRLSEVENRQPHSYGQHAAGPAASAPLPDAESDAQHAGGPATSVDWRNPQRGDRVRLEGARTAIAKTPIVDGWYDVVGNTDGEFEIIAMRYSDGGHWLAWVPPGDHVKEIRPGAAKLDE